jgi:metal-sulfur cluster biosynthetic enzyme
VSLHDADTDARMAEIYRALGRVCDPELDEPVTDLRFIDRVAIGPAGEVEIGFRLPTYWCAANFAFLMADDMRREVSAIPWVSRVDLQLGEHMYAEKINAGVAGNLSFHESFGDAAGGDLDTLRQTFLVKAFQRRQEALLRHLLAAGRDAAEIVSLSVDGLRALDLSAEGERLRRRYLERRDVCAPVDATVAFVDVEGAPLGADDLPATLRDLGRVGVSAEFNGALCRGLLAARFGEAATQPGQEPTLQDFIRDAARAFAGTAARGDANVGRAM